MWLALWRGASLVWVKDKKKDISWISKKYMICQILTLLLVEWNICWPFQDIQVNLSLEKHMRGGKIKEDSLVLGVKKIINMNLKLSKIQKKDLKKLHVVLISH